MTMRAAGFLTYMVGAMLLQIGTALIWLAPND